VIDLQTRDLSMSFGGNQVLSRVSFTVDRPQICGLIGPNGAGKSTLINVLTGAYPPTGGAVLLAGERIDGLPPYALARRGLGRTFQVSRAFRRMTVLENLLVPGFAGNRRGEPRRATLARAAQALELLSIGHLAHEPARALSGGQLKLLELARLLMLDPAILLLDEPFAGVHPRLREHISGFVKRLRSDGRAVIVVEHDMETIFALAERLLVLATGRLVADGPPEAVRADPVVIEAYLGTDEPGRNNAAGPAGPAGAGEPGDARGD
jgi:branched-chain amino acid transport system ATP-binding protein